MKIITLLAVFIMGCYTHGYAEMNELMVSGVTLLTKNGGRVDWSPLGEHIVFDRRSPDGYYDIWIMDSGGGNQHCLTDKPGFPIKHKGNPAWHPSGRYVAFQAQREDARDYLAAPGKGVANELWVMDNEGIQCWKLVGVKKWPPSGILHPHFSPDGNKLYWAQLKKAALFGLGEWELKVADFSIVNGVPQVSNIKTFQPGGSHYFYESHGFTPDGNQILFTVQPRNAFNADEGFMNLSTGEVTYLTDSKPPVWNEHGHISPDGRRVIWVTNMNGPKEHLNLWVMNIDGSEKKKMIDFHDKSVSYYTQGCGPADSSWSPDGMRLAVYVIADSGDKKNSGMIYRINLKK